MRLPSSSPKVVAEKARREKPLSISSIAIMSQPKPKPIIIPSRPLKGPPTLRSEAHDIWKAWHGLSSELHHHTPHQIARTRQWAHRMHSAVR